MFDNWKLRYFSKSVMWTLVLTIIFSVFGFRAAERSAANYLLFPKIKLLSEAAASEEKIRQLPGWPQQHSDLQPDPALVFGRLPNGFRYVLMENHTPRDRVSMHLNVQAGSLHESANQLGLAHFLEHMLFNGSTHFKPGELVKYFQSIGMQFGPDANAHTGFNETVYDLLLPDGSKASLEKGLLVISDYAQGALLLQSEIDRERRVVLAEKRTRDSAAYRTFVANMKFEFPDARISKRLPIGSEDVLKRSGRSQVKAFYDAWYRPENMILVMVGDFEAEMAASLIEKELSSLSSRAPAQAEPEMGKIEHRGIKAFYHYEKEAGNTTVSIEVVRKVDREPDSISFQKSTIIQDIADRLVQNRLDSLIGKAHTPFTSASIGSGIYLGQIEYAEISAQSNPENWTESLAMVEQTLRQALEHGFTASELERVKNDHLAELDKAVKTAVTRESQELARQIINSLNDDRVFMSPLQEKELFADYVKSLTLGQVQDAFRRTWAPEHRLILVTGNVLLPEPRSEALQRISAVFTQSQQIAISQPVEKKAVAFPYLPEPVQNGRILRQTRIADLDIVQVDFENGLRLNIKKTDFEANSVLVNLAFGNGRSGEPADRPGLSAVTEELINESGLGALEKEELDRAMAGKQTRVVFNVGEDRFIFHGETVPDEIALIFQLLRTYLLDPGFRPEAYNLIMARFDQQYLALSRSVDGAMELFGKRFLAGGDSRFGLPSKAQLEKVTLADVRAWIQPYLSQSPLEMSVVGDFDIDTIVQIADRYLGSIATRPNHLETERSGRLEFPVAQTQRIKVKTEIPKAMVVVAYPTEDYWNIQRTRRFSVLAEIFSDRLREQIREKLGASYSPFAYNRGSRAYSGYGLLQVFVHVAPSEIDLVLGEVRKIVAALEQGGISRDELDRALDPILTSLKDLRRTNRYWLDSVLTGSTEHPEQLDWSRTITKDYASVNVEDVSLLAQKYLKNQKAATFIIKPDHLETRHSKNREYPKTSKGSPDV